MLISILFLDIKKPAFAGFFMTPISVLENGAQGRTRTGTLCGRGILNPLCLPISPPGHTTVIMNALSTEVLGLPNLEAEVGIEPASTELQSAA